MVEVVHSDVGCGGEKIYSTELLLTVQGQNLTMSFISIMYNFLYTVTVYSMVYTVYIKVSLIGLQGRW